MRGLMVFLFFWCVCLIARGQVNERFADGDFTDNPSWSGDGADFYVNSAGLLQLNASAAGSSFLSVPISLPASDSMEWRFFIRQNFAPSSSNYGRIYLISDSENTESAVNGYYLQFGETLGNDAIELFRQTGTTSVSLCRGPDAGIAAAFSLYIKVLHTSSGKWQIFTAPDSVLNYSLSSEVIDPNPISGNYFSLRCTYTVGNIANFWFDDIYAGAPVTDTILPVLNSFEAISSNTLSVCFSEAVQVPQLNALSIPGNVTTAVVADTTGLTCYSVYFANPFSAGNTYTLTVSGIYDLAGNGMEPSSTQFVYYPSGHAVPGDVIISEIYFEPVSASPLPYGEYIELYNRSSYSINLQDWILTDGSSDAIIPAYTLLPQSYVLLHGTTTNALFSAYPNQLSMVSFPTLNNDVGDKVKIIDDQGIEINTTIFSDESYHSTTHDDGGWSIERKDFNFPCDDIDNWSVAVATLQGSPGVRNSISGSFTDTLVPAVLSLFPVDSFHVSVLFSEAIMSGAQTLSNYMISSSGETISVLSMRSDSITNSVILETGKALQSDLIYRITMQNLSDCSGNTLAENSLLFGFAETAKSGDVLINEVMNYPKDDGTDYIELVNVSNSLIDLQNWKIKEAEFGNNLSVRSESVITDQHYILWPGRYVLLSRNKKQLFPQYVCKDLQAFLDVPDLPDFNAEDGSVVLTDNSGNEIDQMNYIQSMHFQLLADLKGVALERTSFKKVEGSLWHSAAATAGFGTPGYKNSQLDSVGENSMQAEPEVFSPDNDGYQDLLHIYLEYPMNETVLSVYIYNTDGTLIKKLVDGETVSNKAEVIWDGNDDLNSPAATGTYVIVADSFRTDGKRDIRKKAVVLVRMV